MKIIDPGHVYDLQNLDGPSTSTLYFVKREGPGYPGNVGHHEGTNMQEVLRALIDRLKYVNGQAPDNRNALSIAHLRTTLWLLEDRAADRHGRELNVDMLGIELLPTCPKCGHLGCVGACHD
jgi:hypothetical protein